MALKILGRETNVVQWVVYVISPGAQRTLGENASSTVANSVQSHTVSTVHQKG